MSMIFLAQQSFQKEIGAGFVSRSEDVENASYDFCSIGDLHGETILGLSVFGGQIQVPASGRMQGWESVC